MSSESIGLGSVTSFNDPRVSQASGSVMTETRRSGNTTPNESVSATPPVQELNSTEISEALADQAMEKVQKTQQESSDLSTDDLKDILEEVNNLLYSMNRALRFEVHDKTEDLVVRVVNTKTDEVIRQYPREDIIERRARLLQGELGAFSTEVE